MTQDVRPTPRFASPPATLKSFSAPTRAVIDAAQIHPQKPGSAIRHRHCVFIGSKTHDRTRDGSWRLLEEILRRLRTNVLDLWQIQDVRTNEQLRRISAPDGAITACREAREQGIVRAVGVTGHYDCEILNAVLCRFDADVVTVPVHPADRDWQQLDTLASSESPRHSPDVIAQKFTASGRFVDMRVLSLAEALGYALSQPNVSGAIIECNTPDDVERHVRAVQEFYHFSNPMLRSLEERSARYKDLLTFYRRSTQARRTGSLGQMSSTHGRTT